jgi:hypothetical protein
MNGGTWKTIFGVLAAVASFSLATDLHPAFTFAPPVEFLFGALLVALAVVNPPSGSSS